MFVHDLPGHGAGVAVLERAVSLDEEGLRKAEKAVIDVDPVAFVHAVRVAEAKLIHQCARVRLTRFLYVDADEENIVPVFLPAGLENGHLFSAGQTPRRPEVDDQGSACQLRRVEGGTVLGAVAIREWNREVRRSLVQQRRRQVVAPGRVAEDAEDEEPRFDSR